MEQRKFRDESNDAPASVRLSTADERAALAALSAAELEILKRVVEGQRNAGIAAALGLSPRTVETYRGRVMRKLHADHLPALVKLAIRHGLTSFD